MSQIRRLTPADAKAFREIRIEGIRNHPTAFGSGLANVIDQPLSYFEGWLQDLNVYGTFEDDELVAVAAFAQGKGANACHTAILIAVYARPQAQGRGIMRRMVERICQDAKQEGIEQMTLSVVSSNLAAVKTYVKLGFERYGLNRKSIKYDGEYYDQDLMVRFL